MRLVTAGRIWRRRVLWVAITVEYAQAQRAAADLRDATRGASCRGKA